MNSNDPSHLSADQQSSECYHCGLPLSEPIIVQQIEGRPREFCCAGCGSVCEAIHRAGLQGFYRRTPDDRLLAPPPDLPPDLELFDLDEVQDEYVPALGQQREIHLLVEGIHCAACVWLIENALNGLPGVLEARVNLSGRKLLVRWDNHRASLSRIIRRIGEVGYKAVPFDPDSAQGALQEYNRSLLYRMGFAAFAMMNLLWISIALYTGADRGEYRDLFHWIGFALATPTLIYSGGPFYRGAWSGLRSLRPGMDLPIAIGASITWAYSFYVTITGVGEVYWDTVVNFLFVILVGRYLESISKTRAVESTQRLFDLQPRVATLVEDGQEILRPIRAVRAGELVRVKPGQRIPVDGVIEQGSGEINEAMISGEAIPVLRSSGQRVVAGTINLNGHLLVRVQGTLSESTLGRIIALVEEAQSSKAPIQCSADRIVPWFVLGTIGLALLTFLFWLQQDFALALMAATSVLIITCPCALGMATPMAIAVASGHGARHGILIKNGEVLELLSSIRHLVFDKTGTLTEGRMSLDWVALGRLERPLATREMPPGSLSDETLGWLSEIAAIERLAEHPAALAVVDHVDRLGLLDRVGAVEDFEYQPGRGVRARVNGREWVLGTRDWLLDAGVVPLDGREAWCDWLEVQGAMPLHCARDGRERLVLGLRDRVRADAPELIERLRASGLRLTLLSGDRRAVAESVAAQLGGMDVIAEVQPQDKERVIRELQQQGERIAMVGDGVNDAPALARADVGIAMGTGTEVSIANADVVLMGGDLARVGLGMELSARTLRTIRQNLGISAVYNLIMVPLAMAGLVTPLVAALSMPVSSLLVIGNAARIRQLFRTD